jgi:hypothetical protein
VGKLKEEIEEEKKRMEKRKRNLKRGKVLFLVYLPSISNTIIWAIHLLKKLSSMMI